VHDVPEDWGLVQEDVLRINTCRTAFHVHVRVTSMHKASSVNGDASTKLLLATVGAESTEASCMKFVHIRYDDPVSAIKRQVWRVLIRCPMEKVWRMQDFLLNGMTRSRMQTSC
jgi:hypothetical protein